MTNHDQTVGARGEAAVLAAILERLAPSSRAIIGPGDDAAVLDAPSGRVVATVDTLVHGPDFRLAWSNGYDLGWKSAAVNLADVAAMGARPIALLVALTVPEETPLRLLTDMAEGLRDACAALAPGCAVEGGDLAVSPTLTIAVTALGVLDGAQPVLRSGARPGDVLALAGDAGRAAAGLRVLFDSFRDATGTPIAIDESSLAPEERWALGAQLRPEPPISLGAAAARAGATAMMDVSDGLALDASRMATASAVTLDISASALGGDPATALAGGEDHALLAAFPSGGTLPDGFRRIGTVRERGEVAVLVDGAPYTGRGGWDPYREWDATQG
ncbi:thiamine-phosphate kinase [Microbacterium horticulturae]|uniref:Thiamine-monophosphate kinase n=1 Tax=Microbacterium horticulturae TaxID=3028316 RepID=A0ABY8BU94_9MICO|nr:thiamine-phosphate kinase [Microbacterium sp. KACC 23027]WEG07392.1 thiamine-phosphate kinase [Microbacterium sp. KACC 23027]